MKISNAQFGEMEFNEDQIIKFEGGIAGFEESKRFLMVQLDFVLFYWLVSIDEPEIVFPLVPVNSFLENFPNEINTNPFALVTFNADPTKITVNLRAPLFINTEKNVGYQRQLERYKTNYPLFVKTEED